MVIGDHLRALREAKGLTRSDIRKRTGFAISYISRVENDLATPGINALKKWARALRIPLYIIFYDGNAPPKPPIFPDATQSKGSRKDARFMRLLCRSLARIDERDRQLLLQNVRWMASRKRPTPK
jgi:transcriptional regulator with XRE-family HTH domain